MGGSISSTNSTTLPTLKPNARLPRVPISSLRPGLSRPRARGIGERLHADMARRAIGIADSIAALAQH